MEGLRDKGQNNNKAKIFPQQLQERISRSWFLHFGFSFLSFRRLGRFRDRGRFPEPGGVVEPVLCGRAVGPYFQVEVSPWGLGDAGRFWSRRFWSRSFLQEGWAMATCLRRCLYHSAGIGSPGAGEQASCTFPRCPQQLGTPS